MPRYPEISLEDLWPRVQNGAALVTANRRLARKMTADYAAFMAASNRTAWESPRILPFGAWVGALYDALLLTLDKNPGDTDAFAWPEPLSEQQERWVWAGVIRDSGYGSQLLQASAAAKTAQQAWAICRQWQLDKKILEQAPPPDTLAFLDWLERFENRSRSENWVEAARLPELVTLGIERGLVPLAGEVVFAGFDVYSPQFDALSNAIARRGTKVSVLARPAPAREVSGVCPADTEAEITRAACWARRLLEADPQTPQIRIGIIVPDLQAVRQPLVRIFDDILHPGRVLESSAAGGPDDKRVYNVSLGPPLSAYPMVRTALALLGAARPVIPVETASRLLLSPFPGGAENELARRGAADAALRRRGEVEIDLAQWRALAWQQGCAILSENLRRFAALVEALPTAQAPSGWAERFAGLLESLEWPRGRRLSSAEYQCLEAWQEALARFAAMDRVMGQVSLDTALHVFTQSLSDTSFQPETGDRPIQVLGVLESAGESFDAAWIMGLDNEHWPPAPQPNPLIPAWLQRKYRVAHACPERELAYARQITDRLLGCAPRVVLSYPRREGDAERFASPLIQPYVKDGPVPTEETDEDDGADTLLPGPAGSFWQKFLDPAAVEELVDVKGPEVAAGAVMRGGTGLMKAQASCPFAAFAKYRLGAEAPETPVPGLDAAERGVLLHRCLELFWQGVERQAALAAMTEAELDASIDGAVQKAVAAMAARKPRTFTPRFEAIEKARLADLVREWLALEKKRSPFAVKAREEERHIAIGGFSLRTVADRIDCLEPGAGCDPQGERLVLIDYKTNQPRLRDWFSERMAEPQLPLYAIALSEPLAGVLFAQVRKGEVRFTGVSEESGIAPGIKAIRDEKKLSGDIAAIAELLETWRSRLEDLAEEIRSGYAAVAPESIHESCSYCDLAPICRISEQTHKMTEPEDEPAHDRSTDAG